MKRITLQIVALCLIALGAGAFAQDRAVPQKREQVMLSYAPLVKKISPSVVNIYTKRVVTRREVELALRAAGFSVRATRRYGSFELAPRRLAFRARKR